MVAESPRIVFVSKDKGNLWQAWFGSAYAKPRGVCFQFHLSKIAQQYEQSNRFFWKQGQQAVLNRSVKNSSAIRVRCKLWAYEGWEVGGEKALELSFWFSGQTATCPIEISGWK